MDYRVIGRATHRALLHRQSRLGGAAASGCLAALLISSPAWSFCPTALPARLETLLRQDRSIRWSIAIADLEGRSLFRYRATEALIPASNQKLLTTIAALKQLGSEARLQTRLWLQPSQQVLILEGAGDPSFNRTGIDALAAAVPRDRYSQLIGLDDPPSGYWPAAWSALDRQQGYGAPLNRLILLENAHQLTLQPRALGQPLGVIWEDPLDSQRWQVRNRSRTVASQSAEFINLDRDLQRPILTVAGQLRVGSESEPVAIAATQPGQRFLEAFQRRLQSAGSSVETVRLQTSWPSGDRTLLTTVDSPPLRELIRTTNEDSQNLYAEALLRWLGREGQPDPVRDRRAADQAELRQSLQAIGISTAGLVVDDGSGLSRRNRVSAQTLLEALLWQAQQPTNQTLRASLPIAGSGGTLRRRFTNSPLRGRVQAKTGFLTGAAGLSGFADLPNYGPIAFSILANQPNATNLGSRIDRLVNAMAPLSRCDR
ncbi:D-alanyl-D-alanine carboxypeptidase/D-alanyl-D-alanine-endopeptidase [Synechococcus elongatus IITB7]|uniref:D-alanyl-D-alanine carboxypeptidase/D-alanyl-D-alanine endopeptidase n=1 Tax=Synechococcus elongatus TaxID=32046 RepID=UPI0030D53FE3